MNEIIKSISIENFVALTAPHPAIRHPQLIRHDLEHRGTGWAAGDQAHRVAIVGTGGIAYSDAVIKIQPSSRSATASLQYSE